MRIYEVAKEQTAIRDISDYLLKLEQSGRLPDNWFEEIKEEILDDINQNLEFMVDHEPVQRVKTLAILLGHLKAVREFHELLQEDRSTRNEVTN